MNKACQRGCAPPMTYTTVDEVVRRKDGRFAIITNLPVYECETCGEQIFPPDSIRILTGAQHEKMSATKEVAVDVYDAEHIDLPTFMPSREENTPAEV